LGALNERDLKAVVQRQYTVMDALFNKEAHLEQETGAEFSERLRQLSNRCRQRCGGEDIVVDGRRFV
jgi:hypothetical protein